MVICSLQFSVGERERLALRGDIVACLRPIHVLTVSWEILLSARRAKNMPPLGPKVDFRFSPVCQISATTIAAFGSRVRSGAFSRLLSCNIIHFVHPAVSPFLL
jgi:hypothetical protein